MVAKEIPRANYLENLNKPTPRTLAEDKLPTSKYSHVKNGELIEGGQLTTTDKITFPFSKNEHIDTDNRRKPQKRGQKMC